MLQDEFQCIQVTWRQGRDVIAQSQSGTGKTAMLSIAALQVRECEG